MDVWCVVCVLRMGANCRLIKGKGENATRTEESLERVDRCHMDAYHRVVGSVRGRGGLYEHMQSMPGSVGQKTANGPPLGADQCECYPRIIGGLAPNGVSQAVGRG